jgi:hypothetical protein
MTSDFDSIRNYYEQAVFRRVMSSAADYPQLATDGEVLADVACVALNRLPPKYIRNQVDMNFFMSSEDRAKIEAAVEAAVTFAFRFMASRAAAPARK